jgi:N-methylhydantoinase A
MAFMRYVGQGHEIPVLLPLRTLSLADTSIIRDDYEREYAKFFDRPVPGSDVEVMSYAVVLTTTTPEITVASPTTSFTDLHSIRSQLVRDTSTGATASWPVHDRATMGTGARVRGPAIIAEDETSTLVNAGWHAFVNSIGYIEIIREAA